MEDHAKINYFDHLPNDLHATALENLLNSNLKNFLAFALVNEEQYLLCYSLLQTKIKSLIHSFNLDIPQTIENNDFFAINPPPAKRRKRNLTLLKPLLVIYKNHRKFANFYARFQRMLPLTQAYQLKLENFLRDCIRDLELINSNPFGYSVSYIAAFLYIYLRIYGVEVELKDSLGRTFNLDNMLFSIAKLECRNARALWVLWQKLQGEPIPITFLGSYRHKTISQLWLYILNPMHAEILERVNGCAFALVDDGWADAFALKLAFDKELFNNLLAYRQFELCHPFVALVRLHPVLANDKFCQALSNSLVENFNLAATEGAMMRAENCYTVFGNYGHFLTLLGRKKKIFPDLNLTTALNKSLVNVNINFYELNFLAHYELFVNWSLPNFLALTKTIFIMPLYQRCVLMHCYGLIALAKNADELIELIECVGSKLRDFLSFSQAEIVGLTESDSFLLKSKIPIAFDSFVNFVENINHITKCADKEKFLNFLNIMFSENISLHEDNIAPFASYGNMRWGRSPALQNLVGCKLFLSLFWVPGKLMRYVAKQNDPVAFLMSNPKIKALFGMSYCSLKRYKLEDFSNLATADVNSAPSNNSEIGSCNNFISNG